MGLLGRESRAPERPRCRDPLAQLPFVPRGVEVVTSLPQSVAIQIRRRTNATVGACRGLWAGRLDTALMEARDAGSLQEWNDATPAQRAAVRRIAQEHAALLEFPDETSETLAFAKVTHCLLYTSPSPRDATLSRMPSSA